MTETVLDIDGSPTKGFFIDILTKDISLNAAILDLVDNSVDSAHQMNQGADLAGREIQIVANGSEFSITDNCAGIELANARDYVFRMGRPDGVGAPDGSIGQFGVGMKRALFKIGRSFTVESRTSSDHFTVDLDVNEWIKDDTNWRLPLAVQESLPESAASESAFTGTTLVVSPLYGGVSSAFSNDAFLKELRNELRSRHRLAIGNGLRIVLNGDPVVAADSEIAFSDLLKPAVRQFSINTDDGEELCVRIVVGIAAKRETEIEEDAEPEAQIRPAADAGWLVFGNGRLLLANDKSRITGWGSGKKKIPQFHNQYARFRGFVYLTASNAKAIPWNTMKTGVDADSSTWAQILDQMIEAARSIIDLLNMAKLERQLASDGMDTPISNAIKNAVPADALEVLEVHFSMTIGALREEQILVNAYYPTPNPELVEAWRKIQYSVQASSFDELAKAVGTVSAAELGRMSFEAFHELNVGS